MGFRKRKISKKTLLSTILATTTIPLSTVLIASCGNPSNNNKNSFDSRLQWKAVQLNRVVNSIAKSIIDSGQQSFKDIPIAQQNVFDSNFSQVLLGSGGTKTLSSSGEQKLWLAKLSCFILARSHNISIVAEPQSKRLKFSLKLKDGSGAILNGPVGGSLSSTSISSIQTMASTPFPANISAWITRNNLDTATINSDHTLEVVEHTVLNKSLDIFMYVNDDLSIKDVDIKHWTSDLISRNIENQYNSSTADEIALRTIAERFENFKSQNLGIDTEILPSDLHDLSSVQLGRKLDIQTPNLDGASIYYSIKNANDYTGEIIINARISYSGSEVTIPIRINGGRTWKTIISHYVVQNAALTNWGFDDKRLLSAINKFSSYGVEWHRQDTIEDDKTFVDWLVDSDVHFKIDRQHVSDMFIKHSHMDIPVVSYKLDEVNSNNSGINMTLRFESQNEDVQDLSFEDRHYDLKANMEGFLDASNLEVSVENVASFYSRKGHFATKIANLLPSDLRNIVITKEVLGIDEPENKLGTTITYELLEANDHIDSITNKGGLSINVHISLTDRNDSNLTYQKVVPIFIDGTINWRIAMEQAVQFKDLNEDWGFLNKKQYTSSDLMHLPMPSKHRISSTSFSSLNNEMHRYFSDELRLNFDTDKFSLLETTHPNIDLPKFLTWGRLPSGETTLPIDVLIESDLSLMNMKSIAHKKLVMTGFKSQAHADVDKTVLNIRSMQHISTYNPNLKSGQILLENIDTAALIGEPTPGHEYLNVDFLIVGSTKVVVEEIKSSGFDLVVSLKVFSGSGKNEYSKIAKFLIEGYSSNSDDIVDNVIAFLTDPSHRLTIDRLPQDIYQRSPDFSEIIIENPGTFYSSLPDTMRLSLEVKEMDPMTQINNDNGWVYMNVVIIYQGVERHTQPIKVYTHANSNTRIAEISNPE